MNDEQSNNSLKNKKTCPKCNSVLIENFGYVTWCDKCEWNIQPEELYRPANFFESLYIQLGIKHSKNLFSELIEKDSTVSEVSLIKIITLILAGIVHIITLAVLGTGIVYLIKGLNSFLHFVFGLFILGIAWVLKPKINKMEYGLPKDKYPVLYEVVNRISQVIGAKNIDEIIINHKFNAGFKRGGLRGKRILYLGLPLFSILNDQEKVALIAHEAAHNYYNDNIRSVFIHTAVNSLIQWYDLIRPPFIFNLNVVLISIALLPYHLIQFIISKTIWLIAYILCHLLWRNSQKAEYNADYLAATVSGKESMISMLEKLYYGNIYDLTIQRVALDQVNYDFFDEFKNKVDNIPEKELERIKRLEEIEDLRLDATHPPTFLRKEFLKQKSMGRPKYELQQQECKKINDELKDLQNKIQERLVNDYIYSIS